MDVGPYRGDVAEAFQRDDFLHSLRELGARLHAADAQVIAEGRNRNVRISLTCGGRPVDAMVKTFGRETWLKNRLDDRRGSKARRTWLAANALAGRGVGTPRPLAYLERWEGGNLVESHFLSEYVAGTTSFRDELMRLFHDDPECARFMDLLNRVARGIRAMHSAGYQHNDLGNQNILLRRVGEDWGEPHFIDLNRGRLRTALTLRQRARDLSRITLPSDLLRVFLEMYWAQVPPPEFLRWEQHYRARYRLHAATRRWRHPIREARAAKRDRGQRDYPQARDLWIWDERSAQAISAWRPRERNRLAPLSRLLRPVGATAAALPGVWTAYRRLLPGAFCQPVAMAGRVGVALDPQPDTHERELSLLRELGPVPVLVRFYAHESVMRRDFRIRAVQALAAQGRTVAIALVQDRKSVRDPLRWRDFGSAVLAGVGPCVAEVEVGHAINRVKWGVWDWRELSGLYGPLADWRAAYPRVRWMGPAAIDFEYPSVLAALEWLPAGQCFDALSHHLYVDRRGAPENRQGRFSAVEKFALARAMACVSPACADRLVVSEVNWPILGAGLYSPVNSPYESPGPRFGDPSVSEDDYADFMLRYLCLALCSGFVDRVYWWRLVARGFGLVDDTDPAAWRKRPAFEMLRVFLETVGQSTFQTAQLPQGALQGGATTGGYRFNFQCADGEHVGLCYAHGGARPFREERGCVRIEDAFGKSITPAPSLTGRPVYVRGAG